MKTTNYDLFSFFKENRPISKGNIKQKIASIKEIGYIESCPILVNENFQIIDGQHRFLALKELNMPIVYSIEQLDSSAVIQLNKTQQIWRLSEYIHYHASLNNPPFVIVQNALLNNSKLGTTAVLTCFGIMSSMNGKEIKTGNGFKIYDKGNEMIDYLMKFSNLEHYRRRDFVRALFVAFTNLNEYFLKKLVKNQLQIPVMVSRASYLVCFENILNKNVKESEKISLINI